MKIALVHDWIGNISGAERVLFELHKIFPEAPIYTLFSNNKLVKEYIPKADIRTSFIQKIPFHKKIYPYLLPLLPIAIESFDLSQFDVVISSSNIFSKGLILKPKTKHICYCYSPSRFLWDRNTEYENQGWFSKISRHLLRIWDHQAASRVDEFVAISKVVQDRIKKYYHRESEIIYPPVTLKAIFTDDEVSIKDYYLIVSRLYPHKNINLAVQAFNKSGKNLIVIGDGPEMGRLQKIAKENIYFLGHQSDENISIYYQNCKAFIMPQEEDFGITPIEAMSFGKPVLALRKGGAIETIIEGQTGEFFDDPIAEALTHTILEFEKKITQYHSGKIGEHAAKFSAQRFREEILRLVEK
jgi:glycosyltransferase involved in cell wall biosynthesis